MSEEIEPIILPKELHSDESDEFFETDNDFPFVEYPVNPILGGELISNRSNILMELPGDKLANRFQAPQDKWYHIVPKGEYKHPTGVIQVLDDSALESMERNFQNKKEKETAEGKFAGLLVDFDHLSQVPNTPTEASGWIVNLQRRTDGLYGQIDWTDIGEPAVLNGRYKFVSPVWEKKFCVKLADNKLRPMVLDSLALTNDPNMRDMRPLTA